jgi:hypothetical protein
VLLSAIEYRHSSMSSGVTPRRESAYLRDRYRTALFFSAISRWIWTRDLPGAGQAIMENTHYNE